MTATYNNIYSYISSLIAFRDSRINLFQAIKDQLSALLTLNNNFNTQLGLFQTRVTQFYNSVTTLYNLITDSTKGLSVSSNCQNVADKLRFTYNMFCINFMAQIVKLCICSLLLLGLMFGGIIAGCRFGIIYA